MWAPRRVDDTAAGSPRMVNVEDEAVGILFLPPQELAILALKYDRL
jgi:hypothetical protein